MKLLFWDMQVKLTLDTVSNNSQPGPVVRSTLKYHLFVKQFVQGFIFKNARRALNGSSERFKESCQESDSYEHHLIATILGELNLALPRED